MAVNESRNLNHELAEGLTDGVVKKWASNRGGDTTSVPSEIARDSFLPMDRYDPAVSAAANAAAARRLTSL